MHSDDIICIIHAQYDIMSLNRKDNIMAYRNSKREQMTFLPPCIEEYVSLEDPVRAYDAFVEVLDLKELGIIYNPYKVGNSEYNPKTMLKLLVYGYSYGWKSSRLLERALHHNLSFIWLMGGLKPDHKTISEFRRSNKSALKKVLKQCVRMCIALDLIDGNILFTDGTKIRANAARGKNYTKKHYEKQLATIDEYINKLLNECDRIDQAENKQESLTKMKKELKSSQQLQLKIKDILQQFKEQEEVGLTPKTINRTDPDSALMRSIQGSHASYNAQSVVDDKNGLIVHADVVSDTSDVNQFAQQITQAEAVLEKQCEVASADAGYADTDELDKIGQRRTKVIVPSQRQALHEPEKPYSKSQFIYDESRDCYTCPKGQKLAFKGKDGPGKLAYRVVSPSICKECNQYGICTKSKRGRKIVRLENEHIKEQYEREYEEKSSQEIYARRKTRVEHPFGHIKHNLGMKHFLLRGREGVQAEFSIGATCFNIARMITIFGSVTGFASKLAQV